MQPEQPTAPAQSGSGQNVPLARAFAMAVQHQAQGHLTEAEKILRQILQAQPRHAGALQLLGVVAHAAGNADLATDLINQAIAIDDSRPLFHANLGEMYRLQGRLEDAVRHGERAVELDPKMAFAHSNLGIAYFDLENYPLARASQERALRLEPNLPQALNNMGSILRKEENVDEALTYYHRAVAANPAYGEPLNNLGATLLEAERPEEAVAPLSNAIMQNPNNADANCNLGFVYFSLEQTDKAMPHFEKALAIRPEYAEAYVGIAKVHMENDQLDEAQAAALRALELDAELAATCAVLGNIYTAQALPEKALEYFQRARVLDPEMVAVHLGEGHLHMEYGDFAKAEVCIREALALEPDSFAPRFGLAQLHEATEDDENFAKLRNVDDAASLNAREASAYHYALGKCYEDTKAYDLAFEHFLEGAKRKRATLRYDTDDNQRSIEDLMTVFSSDFVKRLRGTGHPSDLPIFVLGMPRSGTTLTEQIIASHPQVHGAGELRDLNDLASRVVSPAGREYPLNMSGLNPQGLQLLGNEYLKRLVARAPDSPHITDKMPGNFQLVGLIHLMLPNAKIVHVNRNPLDTCISGFARLFRRSQNQSYDLYEQGLFYQNYYTLMAHWRDVLPAGAFYDVQYETLVKDNEKQARQLIEYCELPWDDACLESHKTKRTIKTASITQVRQPIYTTSIERWRRYEQFLEPLRRGLGDVVLGDF